MTRQLENSVPSLARLKNKNKNLSLDKLCARRCRCTAQEAQCGGRRNRQRLQEGGETGRFADLGPCGQGNGEACSLLWCPQQLCWWLMLLFQQWNKHYCVISDDKLYYAEEEEQEEEDTQKVRSTERVSVSWMDLQIGKHVRMRLWLHLANLIVFSNEGSQSHQDETSAAWIFPFAYAVV